MNVLLGLLLMGLLLLQDPVLVGLKALQLVFNVA